MSNDIIALVARFVDAETGALLTFPDLRVRFVDADAISDDVLGTSPLDAEGAARVLITPSSYRSGLVGTTGVVLGEQRPGLCCEVAWDTPVERCHPVTGVPDRTVDLGTFRFRRGEGVGDDWFALFPPPSPYYYRSYFAKQRLSTPHPSGRRRR